MKNIQKQVILRCIICGNDQFSTVDENIEDVKNASDETVIKCSDCGRMVTKNELIEENSENIEINIEETKKEMFEEVLKKFGGKKFK